MTRDQARKRGTKSFGSPLARECCNCGHSATSEYNFVADLVNHYIEDYRPRFLQEANRFRNYGTLPELFRNGHLWSYLGSRGLKKHPHQQRISSKLLQSAVTALRRNERELLSATKFHEVLRIVTKSMKKLRGIGALAIYDFTLRISHVLRLSPTTVYLHAGTRDGAMCFGVKGDSADKNDFDPSMSQLEPAEIEDFLCVFKGNLKKLLKLPSKPRPLTSK
ncbi:MAG: hypothetical protein HY245_10005 [Rhizobiales bacterium]|nr:hypothetical protein [Hyphomicrobiales bacterium]MBI3673734.1 hypothetical protein [Hyphomicrobiales bacterium]